MLPSEVEKQDYYRMVQVLATLTRLNDKDQDKPQKFLVPGPEDD